MSEQYPEHEKLKLINDKSQTVYDFIEWLREEKDIVLASFNDGDLHQPLESIDKLLAAFFEIDLEVLEQEKRAMIEECRKLNESNAQLD